MNVLKDIFSLRRGEENKAKVREDVLNNISYKGSHLWILACAIMIASIGLNMNSTAVVIGAMLISPLMGPIVGAGFALATYDIDLLRRSFKNLLIATLVGLAVSGIYFYLSPFKDVQSELLSRTSPTIYDVLIAFFGGIVGAIAITRTEKGNPIPGVAIATALMPPLCTAGFGIASMNIKFLAGALYLYSINCFFIGISTFLIIKYLRYHPIITENKNFDRKVKYIITALMLLMIIPSSYLAWSLLQEKRYIQEAESFIRREFTNNGYTIIYKKIDYNANPKRLELAFLTDKFDSAQIRKFEDDLAYSGLKNSELVIKQNTSDLKEEIMSEINKRNLNISEKDLQISSLTSELNKYRIGSRKLQEKVKILFPEISEVSFGVTDRYITADSVLQSATVIYKSAKPVDEEKLTKWLQSEIDFDEVHVLKQ